MEENIIRKKYDVEDQPDQQEGKQINTKDIELTEIEENVTTEDSTKTETRKKFRRLAKATAEEMAKQMTFCNTVGFRGVLIVLLVLIVSAVHFIALYIYTKTFQYMKRRGIWIFFFFFLVFLLLAIYLLLRWKYLTKIWMIRHYGVNKSKRNNNNPIQKLRKFYKNYFGLERGKYFFWRTYLFEIIENWIQLFNIQTIHLCTLPLGWSITFSLILIIESSYRSFLLANKLWFSKEKKITVADRNIQYSIDTVIDLFFLVVPLAVITFGYGIWTSVNETTLMLLTPSISLYSKLKRLMLENTIQNAEIIVIKNRDKFVAKISSSGRLRNRKSFFGRDFNDKVSALQNAQFKRKGKLIVFTASMLYVIIVITTVISEIIALADVNNKNCNAYINENFNYWKENCQIKVPLCNDMFKTKCDCAVLKIVGHNMTKLHDVNFVKMTSLRSATISRGRLQKLPDNMELLIKMNRFDVSFNNLQTFDVDVLKWTYLSQLWLMFNNITQHNKNLWQHPELVNLAINSNKGLWMPLNVDKLKLPQLIYLHMGNNSGIIPSELSSKQLPSIIDMYLDGNKMENLPSKFNTFQTTLQYLGVARCGLKELQYLESFQNLRYLDARNNSLISVSSEIKKMMKDTVDFESYFSGNSVCQSDKDLNCTPLCTEYCWSEKGFNNNVCDVTCDSRECGYDGGECKI